jgi:hypothetical protein
MEVQWVNLLLQIPLAGIVVFLTVRFLSHLQEVHKDTLRFIADQSQVNRDFLLAQRTQMNLSIDRLSKEINENKVEVIKEVAALTGIIDRIVEKLSIIEGMTKK